ncbi:hypothetical protein LINPERPRIM_LOCUS29132 [Linum perenne]
MSGLMITWRPAM